LTAYREVLEAPALRDDPHLDLGGDKQAPYFGHRREANLFMAAAAFAWQRYPSSFRRNCERSCRPARPGQLAVPDDFHAGRGIAARHVVRAPLEMLRAVPFVENVPFGVMPKCQRRRWHDTLLDESISCIGSNDLIQYLMAADRDNPKVAQLCEPFGPALYRLLNQILKACNERGTPVTLCGEMAGRPRCVLPLIGMGLRRLSMSPAFVPSIKELLRRLPLSEAQEIADRVLCMTTLGEIRGFLTRSVETGRTCHCRHAADTGIRPRRHSRSRSAVPAPPAPRPPRSCLSSDRLADQLLHRYRQPVHATQAARDLALVAALSS
jgi:phosphoenolpyruvate-protein kinase (PTS system EI component)